MDRRLRSTHRSRQCTIILLTLALAACVHSSRALRPPHRASYWEALAELHPVDAVSVARTESEKEFAEALGNLMAADLENAEHRFDKLRRVATDSVIRAASRVTYTATLQYQEKWETLAALKRDPSEPKADRSDKASIELWAEAFRNIPAKTFTFRSSSMRLPLLLSAVGTPLVPWGMGEKGWKFGLETGSGVTRVVSDIWYGRNGLRRWFATRGSGGRTGRGKG